MDPTTLRRWRSGELVEGIRSETDALTITQTFLRLIEHYPAEWFVETLAGDRVTILVFLKFYSFARRARRVWKPQFARMRLARYGHAKDVTATHAGDLRIGCTLVPWSELDRIYDAWRALPAAVK